MLRNLLRREGVVRLVAAWALCLLLAPSLFAQEAWKTNYERGLAAADKLDWNAAADAMQKAAAGRSDEDAQAKIGKSALPYLPWYWLGISLLNSGDTAGAIDALRRSESQGAVQKTAYASSLREALNVAQSQKGRSLKDINDAKKADEAIGRAMTRQLEASAAGALREEKYRLASQKLRVAFDAKKTGTPAAIQQATQAATEAAELFAAATQDAKAGRRVVTPTPIPPKPDPVTPPKKEEQTPVVVPTPKKETGPVVEPVKPVVTPRENTVPDTSTAAQSTTTDVPAVEPRATFPQQLVPAFREFASGRFAETEQMIAEFLRTNPRSADAYMLRGCGRYVRGVLEKNSALVAQAGDDFRTALLIRPQSNIDERYFSPKLVSFFRSIQGELRR